MLDKDLMKKQFDRKRLMSQIQLAKNAERKLAQQEVEAAQDELAAAIDPKELALKVNRGAACERNARIALVKASQDWDAAMSLYEKGKKNYLEASTSSTYMTHIRTFVKWVKVDEEAEQLIPAAVSKYVVEAFIEYQLDELGNSKRTVNDKLFNLKDFFGYLAKEGAIPHNPVAGIKPLPRQETPIHSFTPEQMRKLFAMIPNHTWRGARDYSLFRMLADTGCRLHEAQHLRIDQLEFELGVPVFINFLKTKNHTNRKVAVPASLAEAFLNWMSIREQYGVSVKDAPVLHIGTEMKPPGKDNLRKYFREYAERAGVEDQGVRCSPYTLKHTFCKLFLLAGGRETDLRDIIGHIDQRSLAKYTKLTQKESWERHKQYCPGGVYNY